MWRVIQAACLSLAVANPKHLVRRVAKEIDAAGPLELSAGTTGPSPKEIDREALYKTMQVMTLRSKQKKGIKSLLSILNTDSILETAAATASAATQQELPPEPKRINHKDLVKSMDVSDNAHQVVDDAYRYARTGELPNLYGNCETTEDEHEPYDVAQMDESYNFYRKDYAKIYSCLSCSLEKEGIRHWAMEGQLVGIARNQSFIPWDDDLDMGVLVTDLGRLVRFQKEVLGDESHPSVKACRQCQGLSRPRVRRFFDETFDWFPHLPTAILNSSSTKQNYVAGTGCNAYPALLWHKEEDVFPLQHCQLKDISAVVPECGDGKPSEEYSVLCPRNIDSFLLNRGFGRREDWMHPRPQKLFKPFMNPASENRKKFIAMCRMSTRDYWD